MADKKVKLKILKNVGPYLEGQEVDVSEADAVALCTVRKVYNGYEAVDFQCAMRAEDYERLKALPVDQGGLTVDEAQALGLRNVVALPQSELERPFHPGFTEHKDGSEGVSAKASVEYNAKRKAG